MRFDDLDRSMRVSETAHDRRVLLGLYTYVERPFLSFADAFNVVYMRARGITEIYRWDTAFERMDSITRVEPEETDDDEDA